jgi:eukaryotic-like serine/threonine-protein kinase
VDADLRQSLLGRELGGARGARYRLTELAGETRRGWFFRADELSGGARLVAKVFRPDALPSGAIERFSREAEALCTALGLLSASSREIVRVHDHGVYVVDQGGKIPLGFLVREHVAGQSLGKVIAAHGGFGVPVARARRLAGHIARALFALHEVGLVHRDLTPRSVIIVQEGGQERAKVADFMLAAVAEPRTLDPSSLGYAPPEGLGYGSGSIGPATDVFSFAAILYELLCGTAAFPSSEDAWTAAMGVVNGERPSLARVRATLPVELRDRPDLVAALDREIARATSLSPAQRHTGIRELWQALESLLREVVRPAASGAAALDEPVSFESLFPRSSSNPEIAFATPIPAPPRSNPPSTAMPASAARSGPVPLAAPMPAWQPLGPPIAGVRLHAEIVVEEGRAILAAGTRGVYRLARGTWSPAPLPAGVSARDIRGLGRLPTGEVLLFGEAGFCAALSSRGALRRIALADRDVSLVGAHADERGIVLVGERSSRPVGVLCLVPSDEGAASVHTVESTTRLTSAVRLGGGAVVAVGTQGALLELGPSGLREIAWGRTGHLYAVASAPDGAAYAVGSGGHALRVTMARPTATATLEGVQTTRDLFAVAVDPSTGAAWAAGGDARLLERRGDAWVRVPLDPSVTSSLLAVWPRAPRVTVIANDGAAFFCDAV